MENCNDGRLLNHYNIYYVIMIFYNVLILEIPSINMKYLNYIFNI